MIFPPPPLYFCKQNREKKISMQYLGQNEDGNHILPSHCILEDSIENSDIYVRSARWSPDGSCLVSCLVPSKFHVYTM